VFSADGRWLQEVARKQAEAEKPARQEAARKQADAEKVARQDAQQKWWVLALVVFFGTFTLYLVLQGDNERSTQPPVSTDLNSANGKAATIESRAARSCSQTG
jgi:hypothetical protein